MKTQKEQLIAHANQVAKANFMQFDYDEDNPITDLLNAVLVIAFDNGVPEEVELGEIYDELDKRNRTYPFNEGDDYWTIEGGKVTWSCWDDVSEVIHDNESRRIYFSTEQEAINHLKN